MRTEVCAMTVKPEYPKNIKNRTLESEHALHMSAK